jgi:hypothetical protein
VTPSASLIDQYRDLMLRIGENDEVAFVDRRAEELWSTALAQAVPALEPDVLATVPRTVDVSSDAPADFDVDGCLNKVARVLGGHQDPHGVAAYANPRLVGATWLATCLLCAVVLGMTVRGLVVIPAFVPPIMTGALLIAFGVGRLPGFVWAIGLMPLALLLSSGAPPSDHSQLYMPPQWYLGVLFLVLVEGFAYLLRLMGEQDLRQRDEAGKPITDRQILRAKRRPLEVSLVLCTVVAVTDSSDTAAILLIACLAGLLWRRRWTSVLAAAVCAIMVFVASDLSGPWADWAHPIVLGAFVVHWIRAVFNPAWYERLAMTEAVLGVAGSTIRGIYGALSRGADASWSRLSIPTAIPANTTTTEPRTQRYQKDQFPRYCNTCLGSTPHVAGSGLSMPICVQCGSKATGGGYKDRTFPRYCASCAGSTPHTAKGCIVCSSSHR